MPLSGSVAIDALAAGIKWGGAGTGATIAYSFPYANGDAVWASAYSSQDEPDTASGFGSDHQAAARQALQQWANVADLRRFIRSIVQAEQYGLALATVLHTQAAEMRVMRRQKAEEKAMKIPVKVVFPLILCIMPSLFIVIVGPAVISIMEAFGLVG